LRIAHRGEFQWATPILLGRVRFSFCISIAASFPVRTIFAVVFGGTRFSRRARDTFAGTARSGQPPGGLRRVFALPETNLSWGGLAAAGEPVGPRMRSQRGGAPAVVWDHPPATAHGCILVERAVSCGMTQVELRLQRTWIRSAQSAERRRSMTRWAKSGAGPVPPGTGLVETPAAFNSEPRGARF